MHMARLFSFITTLMLLATSCNIGDRQHFSLTIKHYAGAYGITVIYDLDQNGLRIDSNCDLANCEEKTVYKRKFTEKEGDSIYTFINSLRLDTLKSAYETKGIMDGFSTKVSFKKSLFSSKSSTFDNFNTPATDSLFKFIDNLVLIKKYRISSWGQD